MVKVVNSVSDALNSMQKENGGLKAHVKADLQRAPVRGSRFKGCANGKSFFVLAVFLSFTPIVLGFHHQLLVRLSVVYLPLHFFFVVT